MTIPNTASEEENLEEIFKEKYTAKIGKAFDGEILFVEEVNFINL